jgi:hypothetical protein
MDHAWRPPAVAGEDAFGPGAGRVIKIPEESLARGQALRHFEAKRVRIGKLQQESNYALIAATAQAELHCLFDRLPGIALGKKVYVGTYSLDLRSESLRANPVRPLS